MDTKYAAWVLKFLIWVLFIAGGALDLIFLVPQVRVYGLDYWTLLYLPFSIINVAGGLYIILNFDKLPKIRLTVIKAYTAVFIAETAVALATLYASIKHPQSFTPPFESVPLEAILTSAAAGFGFAILIYFVLIRLVNVVAGHSTMKKPPAWMTAAAWAIILLMVAGVFGVFSLGE